MTSLATEPLFHEERQIRVQQSPRENLMKTRMLIGACALALGLGVGSVAFAQGQPMQPGMGGMQGGRMGGGQIQQGGMAGDDMQAQRPMRKKMTKKRMSKKSMKRQGTM
jgi:pentapeptide MXKDX repeat protein